MVPCGMAAGFLILLLYFKSIGGYKVLGLDGQPVEGHASNGGEGGSEGPETFTPEGDV